MSRTGLVEDDRDGTNLFKKEKDMVASSHV